MANIVGADETDTAIAPVTQPVRTPLFTARPAPPRWTIHPAGSRWTTRLAAARWAARTP